MLPILIVNPSGWEGPYYVIALAIAGWFAFRRFIKAGYTADDFLDLFTWVVIGALVGGRLFFFIFWDWADFIKKPLEFFMIWHGGISITGCIVIGALGGYFFTLTKKWDFFKIANIVAPTIILGMAIGRIGCFLNGDAYGIPTTLPWGMVFHQKSIAGMEAARWSALFGHQVKIHPTQLYEVIGDLIIFAVLTIGEKNDFIKNRSFALMFGGYAIVRFFNEFLRADASQFINLAPHKSFFIVPFEVYPLFDISAATGKLQWHYLSGAQFVSLMILTFVAIYFIVVSILQKRDNVNAVEPPSSENEPQ